MKNIILVVASLLSVNLYAQDITNSKLSWGISHMEDMNTGLFEENSGAIISYGIDHIEWRDKHGVILKDFTVREVNGSWSNVGSDGAVVYESDIKEAQYILTFQRERGILLIRIVELRDSDQPLIYEFSIENLKII